MTDQVRYATKNVYADVEEEGGTIRRLVATEGQPIPVAYAELVDDDDTTTTPPGVLDPALARSTSARRETTPTVADAERAKGSTEDYSKITDRAELEAEIERRREAGATIEVTGTGKDGAIKIGDLRAALVADDEAKK